MLFGKTLAEIAYAIPSGIIALVAVFLVSHELPVVADIELIPLSLLLVMFGLAVSSLLFAPLMVLVGGRGGFFKCYHAIWCLNKWIHLAGELGTDDFRSGGSGIPWVMGDGKYLAKY